MNHRIEVCFIERVGQKCSPGLYSRVRCLLLVEAGKDCDILRNRYPPLILITETVLSYKLVTYARSPVRAIAITPGTLPTVTGVPTTASVWVLIVNTVCAPWLGTRRYLPSGVSALPNS